MNNKKSMKRALVSSVLSLVLCMAMLIGTTFAWFTDNATSGVNTIQSGSLDIVLEYYDGTTWQDAEGKTLDFVKAAGAENEAILWEPGCTYQLPALRVRNNGNLALEYEFVVNGVNGDAKLLEVIEWTANGVALSNFEGELKAQNDTSEQIVVQGHMKEDANNDYQGLTVSGISISVFATQLAYEYDSFDNQYDKNALYYDVLVSSADELYNAVATASGNVVIAVDGNITLTKALSKSSRAVLESIKFVAYDEDATIDQATYNMYFSGVKVTFEGLTLTHGEKAYGDGGQTSTAFAVWNAKEVNYIDCTFKRSVGTIHAPLHNFIGCTFDGVDNPDNSKSEYLLYICDGQEYNVTDCVFNATNKGAILFYNDGGSGVDTLNISKCKFLGDIIADKTAVEIHNNAKAQVYNVNIKDVVVGSGVINGLYRIKPANVGEVNVTVDGVTKVATASNSSTLATAISEAKSGDTIYLNTDIDCGASQLAIEKDVTIDLNDKTISADNGWGIISLKNGASLKNGTIDVQSNVAAIRAFNVESIEDVTIHISPKATEKVATAIAVQNGGHVSTIKNVTITGATRGIEVAKGAKVDLIENAKVQAVSNGSKQGTALIINAGYVSKVVNCNFKGEVYGVHMMLNGEYTVGLELDNCVTEGTVAAIYAHDEVGISNTNNCSLTLTYDDETVINGALVWEFEEECKSVITLNAPKAN